MNPVIICRTSQQDARESQCQFQPFSAYRKFQINHLMPLAPLNIQSFPVLSVAALAQVVLTHETDLLTDLEPRECCALVADPIVLETSHSRLLHKIASC